MGTTSRSPLRILIVAPSLDILGGQSRQAVRLMTGLQAEPGLKVDFQAHNPRLPGPFKALQNVKYVRTFLTSLYYFMMLLVRVAIRESRDETPN